MEQKQPLQQMVLGDLDSYMQKHETRVPTFVIHKNELKMDKGHWQENLTFHAATSSQTCPLKQGKLRKE